MPFTLISRRVRKSLISLPLRRFYSCSKFTVRRVRCADELREHFIPRLAHEGWKPGALDYISYFRADNTGFFVGELDGKVISCISAVKYCPEYAFFGNYIVDEEYRNMGYGSILFKSVVASLSTDCNFAGEVYENQVERYEKLGYKRAWKVPQFSFDIAKASAVLQQCELRHPSSINIETASDVPFAKLFEYDTSVHVYPRSSFLASWISASNSFSYVASTSAQSIVGYAVVRLAFRPKDGWRLGPLYADNEDIALYLYRAIVDKLAHEDKLNRIVVDVPCSDQSNPRALAIVDELRSKKSEESIRLFSKYVPTNWPLQKVYGISSQQMG